MGKVNWEIRNYWGAVVRNLISEWDSTHSVKVQHVVDAGVRRHWHLGSS
jgi:hypothetical protein